jgi:hypothetical protein
MQHRKDSEQTKQIEELQKQNEDLTEEKERLSEEIIQTQTHDHLMIYYSFLCTSSNRYKHIHNLEGQQNYSANLNVPLFP